MDASAENDMETIRGLVSIYANEVYSANLPYIRWDALVPKSSANILFIILPLLTIDGITEAAYKLRDPGLLELYGPNEGYAIKYMYIDHIPMNIDAIVQGYTNTAIQDILTHTNYILVLQKALEYNRSDMVHTILTLYASEKMDLLQPYMNMDFNRDMTLYLIDGGYLTPTAVQLSIIHHKVDELPLAPTTQQMQWVILYDALDCYMHWNLDLIDISKYGIQIHGRILAHLLISSSNERIIRAIAMNASTQDLDNALDRGNPSFIPIFMDIAIYKGWLELVEKYSYLVQRSAVQANNMELLDVAVIQGNIPLVQSLVDKHVLSSNRKVHVQYLALKYHAINPDILLPLERILS